MLFGGNPERTNEVVSIIRDCIQRVTAIGNFSEAEGIERLSKMDKVDLVLIGGQVFGRRKNKNPEIFRGAFSRGNNYRTRLPVSV